jgi:hypothetical protein
MRRPSQSSGIYGIKNWGGYIYLFASSVNVNFELPRILKHRRRELFPF